MTLDPRYDYVSILRRRADQQLLIEEMMEEITTGAITTCGEPKSIDEHELGAKVLEALNRFHIKPRIASRLHTSKEQREFVRTHDVVSVTRDRVQKRIEINPMLPSTSGGWLRSPNNLVIHADSIDDEMLIASEILRAFQIIHEIPREFR